MIIDDPIIEWEKDGLGNSYGAILGGNVFTDGPTVHRAELLPGGWVLATYASGRQVAFPPTAFKRITARRADE